MWGDPADQVRAAMLEAGVESEFAEEVIRAAMKERGLEVRAQGIKDLVIGAVIFVAGLAPLVLMLLAAFPSMVLMGGAGLGLAYGGFRVIRGLVRLVSGARSSVDVSSM